MNHANRVNHESRAHHATSPAKRGPLKIVGHVSHAPNRHHANLGPNRRANHGRNKIGLLVRSRHGTHALRAHAPMQADGAHSKTTSPRSCASRCAL